MTVAPVRAAPRPSAEPARTTTASVTPQTSSTSSPASSFEAQRSAPLPLAPPPGAPHVGSANVSGWDAGPVTGTTGAPQTLEEAKVAASKLGAFLADVFQAWRDAGGLTAPDGTMANVFGPPLEGLPPETASLGVHTIIGEFFYSVTAVDLASGNVFQTGPGSLRPFYGPLTPPPEARITGTFNESELYELETAIRQGLRAAVLGE